MAKPFWPITGEVQKDKRVKEGPEEQTVSLDLLSDGGHA